MDMHSKNQYLEKLRVEYLQTRSKKAKGRLLDEAETRTGLNRKYLIRKLKLVSNLDRVKAMRPRRKQYYDGYVGVALVRCWEIFDYPCGQRLKPLLKKEVGRLGIKQVRRRFPFAFKEIHSDNGTEFIN